MSLTSELRSSRNKVAAVFYVVAACCGITWPENERGEPLLPLGSHQALAAAVRDTQVVEARLEHSSAAQAAGGSAILEANNAFSSDGCTTNGKQFESIIMNTARRLDRANVGAQWQLRFEARI